MEFFSIFSIFLANLMIYKRNDDIDLDPEELKRQVAIYGAKIAQIRLVRGGFVDGKEIRPRIELPELFFENHCDALINASAYIKAVDRKLQSPGFQEEIVWYDGDCDEICSHRMICNIFENFWRWDIDEADQLENLVNAIEWRDFRIRQIENALNRYITVSAQYHAEERKFVVQQALEILNHYCPSLTYATLRGLTSFTTLTDDRVIELASKIAEAEREKEDLDTLLDYSETNADYLAAKMGEEPEVSTKKVSKDRYLCKKVKRNRKFPPRR